MCCSLSRKPQSGMSVTADPAGESRDGRQVLAGRPPLSERREGDPKIAFFGLATETAGSTQGEG
jgi:hypothetical protein